MLIIWRRAGQALQVGDDIQIEVLESRTGKVKLGIQAPDSVMIRRLESHSAREENKQAAGITQAAITELLSTLSL